jgi:thiamine pyrophosphokinase
MGLTPDLLVGDMDSLAPEVLSGLQGMGVDTQVYPKEKDFTDMQLALMAARERGASRITVLGGIGDRLDHTMSSLMSCMDLVREGISIRFYRPDLEAYPTCTPITIEGGPGDVVSLLALDPEVHGVTLEGLKYPLTDALLKVGHPYAVSNVIFLLWLRKPMGEKLSRIKLKYGL